MAKYRAATGTEKLNILSELSYAFSFTDQEKQLKFSREGLEYALSERDSNFVAVFLIEIGYYYLNKGNYQEALNNFNRSILVAKNVGNKKVLSKAYTGLGSVYYALSFYDKALKYHIKSLALKEEMGDAKELPVSYINVGLIYYKIDDPDRALEYFDKSLKLRLQKGDTGRSIINYINIGYAYSEKKDSISDQRAIDSFKKAIEYSLKYNHTHHVGFAYNGIAQVFIRERNYDSARVYLNKSIEESIRSDNRKLESSNYFLLAKIAFQQNKFNLAINYLRRSEALLLKLKDKNRLKNNYRLFADIYEKKNMLDSAFQYQKKYTVMKDSIFNEELANNLANVQIASIEEQNLKEMAVKDEEISERKLFNLFLLSILGLSIALIVVIFRNYAQISKINRQLQESKAEIEAQKENLEKKNKQLAEAQITIENKNRELENINYDLDNKVKERTYELDKSNRELEKAVKDLDQFIYKTSHDLRGPIATMQGIINIGIIESTDQKSKGYFETLHKVSNNLNHVLSRLIEVHETYQKKPELEFINPRKEIMEMTNKISRIIVDPDITIITELQANGQWFSDKLLFATIIENMLKNALLYKDRGESIIKVSAEYREKDLVLTFEDNGFGIQPGYEDKVFDIFFKGYPKPGGTGLEVYTAKIAVEKLNGEIILKRPNKNTIYQIILPSLG